MLPGAVTLSYSPYAQDARKAADLDALPKVVASNRLGA
jgi:hypothetical protein